MSPRTAKTGQIRIGTSGWNYAHWKGTFYPAGMKRTEWLKFYSSRLITAEINNSFYQLPEKKVFRRWKDTTPSGFEFSVKASRYITHMKKLKDPDQTVATLLDHASELGSKLGPILFQLPPRWKCNPDRLQAFLECLPRRRRCTFEFRDSSWWTREIYDLLSAHGAAFCIYDLAGTQSPKDVTADFVYIRLHGPGEAYEGQYDGKTLSGWAGACHAWAQQAKDVYCYFDNDQHGYAAQDAARLAAMVTGEPSSS